MFFKDNRGQSALEYLMTYGWALVVIVIVVAALVFLINPAQIGTEGCTGFSKMPITNYEITSTGMQLKATNQTGRALSSVVVVATIDGNSGVYASGYESAGTIAANEEVTFTFTGLTNTGDVTANINIAYNDGDFDRDTNASCQGSV